MNDQISAVTAEELMNMISQWAYNSYLYGEYIGRGLLTQSEDFDQREEIKKQRQSIEIIINRLIPANK